MALWKDYMTDFKIRKTYIYIYNWKDDIFYNNDYSQDMKVAYEELKLSFSVFIQISGYIDNQDFVRHSILYGEGL